MQRFLWGERAIKSLLQYILRQRYMLKGYVWVYIPHENMYLLNKVHIFMAKRAIIYIFLCTFGTQKIP